MNIYIHIPFCLRKCQYCDFYSISHNKETEEKYIDVLAEKILSQRTEEEINTIYVGGGTPSVLCEKSFEKIFNALKKYNISQDAEITVEVNPATCDLEKLIFLKSFFNRISVGVQSFNDNELKILGRLHNSKEAFLTVENAYKVGFENISLDLMYAIPSQNEKSFQKSIEMATNLPITHLSAYELSFEAGTPFGKNQSFFEKQIDYKAPFDYILENMLKENGFEHYEVSNYAKEGFESRHNLNYWDNNEYYGFGAGACEYIGGERRQYVANVREYIDSRGEALEYSEKPNIPFENLMLGLRKYKGFSVQKVTDFLNDNDRKIFLEKVENNSSVILENGILRVKPECMKFLSDITIDLWTWE